MDFRLFIEPQNGATYTDQLRAAQLAEACGYEGFFRSDHFHTMDRRRGGMPGPTDSWVTLGALARETERLRLGTLVSSATFRHPSLLAIQVAQVDEMSGGRIELGLGAGWFEVEHTTYGFPFPEKRFGPFSEQLEIITGLWSTPLGETYTFTGEHYTLTECPALPKPVQQPIPVIVGGTGARKTPALAARYAAEFNCFRRGEDELRERFGRVRAAAEAIGRDPDELTYSIAGTTAIGATDTDVARRADDAKSSVEQLSRNGFCGSPAQVVDAIGRLGELGVSRIYFQVFDMTDLDHIELIASEVLPQLR